MFKSLLKPEYIFNPRQLLRRLRQRLCAAAAGRRQLRLPWGATIDVNVDESIGKGIFELGLYDLPVCEAIRRLLDTGGVGVDGGANIGQMTSLMAACAGPQGKVYAFEPHPQVFESLSANVSRWSLEPRLSPIVLRNAALSGSSGEGFLAWDEGFVANEGTATLSRAVDSPGAKHRFKVPLLVLDRDLVPENISLLKLDVEGHELEILKGARERLAAGEIRFIVYEAFDPLAEELADFLLSYGYVVFCLAKTLLKPKLVDVHLRSKYALSYVSPSFAAARDADELRRRFSGFGWHVL